jgi:tetratricopeptide (TPR) repeat protein
MALLKAFNPHELSAELVHNVATGRERALHKVMSTVRSNLNASTKHHFIVSAPRGYGKSFFLRYVEITIAETAKVEGLPIAMALLPEELPHVKEPDTLIAEMRRTFLKAPANTVSVRWSEDDGSAWDQAIADLDAAIDQRFGAGRGLLVVGIENFDLLIPKAFAKSLYSARLRSLLTRTNGRIMLLAASARGAFDRSYDVPLFQAFEEVTLTPWNIDEVVDFLDAQRRVSGKAPLTNVQRARGKAVATFISGTPRLATLIGEALLDDDPVQAAALLEKLVDELTPYYKERIDILPPRPQALLDALLRGGEPCSATELARRVSAPSQSAIAAPLDDLRKDLLIYGEKAPDSAEVLLRVTDRVFAHYYRKRVLNHGEETCPLESLVDLLSVIYSPEEKKLQAEKFAARGLAREAKVMERLWQADQKRREPISVPTDLEAGEFNDLLMKWDRITDEGRFDEGLSILDLALATARRRDSLVDEARLLRLRGWTLIQLGRYEDAVAASRDAASKAESAGDVREQAIALRIVGWGLDDLGRGEEAVEVALNAAAKAEVAGDIDCQTAALCDAAWNLNELDRYEESLATARDALVKAESTGNIYEQAQALGAAAISLRELGRSSESFVTIQNAVDKARNSGTNFISLEMALLSIRPPDAVLVVDSYERVVLHADAFTKHWPAIFFSSVAFAVTEQMDWPALIALLERLPEAANQISKGPSEIGAAGRSIAASLEAGKRDDALAQARHFVTALARAAEHALDPSLAYLWRGVMGSSVTELATSIDDAGFLSDLTDILSAHPQVPTTVIALMQAAAAYHAAGRDSAKLARLDPDLATTIITVFPPATSVPKRGSQSKRRKKRSR